MNWPWSVTAKGFAMGVADLVPGVSGGTVAFIAGIYDPLLESLSALSGVIVVISGHCHAWHRNGKTVTRLPSPLPPRSVAMTPRILVRGK